MSKDEFVYCQICHRPKKPIGRDSRDNGLCDHDCEGYRLEPYPSTWWPGERDASLEDEFDTKAELLKAEHPTHKRELGAIKATHERRYQV